MRLRKLQFAVALCGAALVSGSVLGILAPAQAHNYLVSSTPAAGSTLTALPDEFVITTNDNLLDTDGITTAFALQVVDSDGRYYGDGCVTVEGPSMSATPALGAPGTYTLLWQVVSADGHTVSDEFDFDWEPTAPVSPSAGRATAPTCGEAETPGASQVSGSTPSSSDPQDALADSADTSTVDSSSAGASDGWWIAGAVVAVGAAVLVTGLVIRRPRRT